MPCGVERGLLETSGHKANQEAAADQMAEERGDGAPVSGDVGEAGLGLGGRVEASGGVGPEVLSLAEV